MNRKYPHFSSTATSKNRPPDRSRTTVKIDRQDEQEPNPSRSSQEPLGLGDQQQNNHHHHRDRGSRINVKPEVGSLLFPKKEPEIFDLGNDSDSELEVVYEKKGSSNTAAASTAVSRKNEQRDVIDVLDSDSDSESSVNKRKLSSSSRRKNNNKFKSSERFGGGLPNGTASTLSSSSSSSSGSSSVIQIESDMEEESNKSGAEDVLMADPADSFNSFGGGNVWEGSYFQDLNNVMPTDDDGGVATSSAPVEVITPKTETPSLNGFETEPEELPDLIDAEEMPIEEVAAERKRLGNEYFTKGEYHRALEMYSNAIDLVPTDPTYFGNRSACLLMMQKFKDAAKDARQALSLDPNFKNGFIRLVRSNIALGDITATELAIASAEAKAELKIDLKDERQKLATLKLLRKEIEQSDEKKDFRKTLYLTERAKSIAVGDVSLKIKRAETLIKLGRYVDAQEQCTEILQSDGMIVEAITLRAYCFYQADSLDKALQYYKQALTLAPDNRTAAVNYKKMKQVKELREAGADSFRNRCWNEANSAYKQCLDLIEADGDGNVVLGSKINFNLALVAGKSDSDLSLSFVNKALSLNPQYVKALLHRAGIYMDVEKFDEAIRDFEAVEKLDPGTSNIRRLIENAKLMAKKAKRKDYYKILGIDKKASTDEIKKAYKKRALDHHPDRHANATETERRDQERKFKEVLEAYEILLDDKKRRRYDMGLDINESASSNYEPFDASAMFGHMFFQHAGMGGMGGRPGGFHQFRAGPGYSGFRR